MIREKNRGMERICVAVRVRPPIKQEVVKGNYWRLEDNHISLHNALGTPISGYSYVFDHVFGYDSKNAIIYEVHTKDVIEAAVHGFNGTVFAYGQTSSGKTYTMQGSSEDPGIIRLAVYNIFQNIQLITDREFLIRVSYMEIYNEEINDLLAPENQKLQVHENLERGIFVAGLREEIVNSPEQVFELVERGEVHRHVGQTNMNVHSSRSHTIFRMVIESRDKDAEMSGSSYNKDAVRVSVLNLVDLAGSERVAKTGAGGVRLKEGTHINKSLMSLGTVINKLSDGGGKQRGHIPYRDSKLTRILQPALGGNAKTAIICTIAPEEVHTDETRGTLQFASRAKRVTNCAQVNEIVTDAALLKRQKREIEELRKKLQGSHSEVLEQEILKLRNDMLKFELEREKLAMELEEERKAQLERDRRIMEQQLKIDNLSTLVINSDQDRNSFKINSCERTYPRRLSLEFSDQDRRSTGNGRESSFDSRITLRKEKFLNPSFEALFDGSAEKQRSGSRRLDGSPLPPNFGNIADEDMWMSLNKGHETSDLEFLQSTPNGNFSSVRSSDISSVHGAVEGYREEIENLKVQLRKAVQDKQELEKCLEDQLMLNGELKMAIFKFEREAALIRRISENLGDAVLDCNEGRKGISTPLQELFAEEKSPNSMVLPFTDEANNTGLANLNGNLKKVLSVLEHYKQKNLELQRQCQMLNEQVKDAKGRHTDNHCSIECQLSQIKNLDEEQEPGSDFDGRKVRKCFGLNANSLWLADNNSEMVSVPISQNFKRICRKVWQLENVLDVVPAIDFDALCSQIEDEFSSILSERSSVSESLTDFIIAISCKHSDKIEVGNLETDKTHRMHNEESDFVCNILDDDSSAFRTKTSCDKVTSTRNLRIVTLELANGVFLAKWLAEELKNLTSHDIGLLFSSVKMNPEIGKLIKGLQICVNEIIKFSSGLQQLSCEKDYPRRNLNLQLKTHEKSREAAVENSPSGIYVDCTINELQQRLAVPAAVQMQFHGGEDLIKNQLPVDASSNSVSLRRDCNFKQEDRLVLLERLCMSAEHILSLDNKLALLNIEKDAISKALDNELHMHEQKQLDARFRELLAEEIRQFTTALAGRDGIYASIRCGIMEFEKNVEKKRAQNFISQATCLEALLPPAQV